MNSYIEKDALYVLRKYPTKVPVMVQKDIRCTLIADLPKRKFIVPKDLQISDFLYYIRRQLQVPEFESIFIFVNDSLPSLNHTIGMLYEEEKDNDGFLYLYFTTESTFG